MEEDKDFGIAPDKTPDISAEEFSLLISKHHIAMKHYISSFCTNPADVEDVCQESYKKAFQAIASFNPKYPFKTWLFTIGRNTALDLLRRKSTISTIKLNESDEPISDNSQIETSPEEDLIDAQKYDAFMAAISSLPILYKRVAELRILHEYSYEEIAKELNLPLNTVRTRIRRAKNIINEMLREL
ncbi:MAG: sigma-70 family RNA polymerase sigma factor [Bacteroidales bacterium]|nr:sigma-70 family RNA polymerase sigma factor [Bacteroidales bacterium]